MHSVEAACKHNQADVQGNRIEAARWVEHDHFVFNHTYRSHTLNKPTQQRAARHATATPTNTSKRDSAR
jgi:hypothetical protein